MSLQGQGMTWLEGLYNALSGGKLKTTPDLPTGAATSAKQDSLIAKFAAAANTSTPYIVICGKQTDGTITPLRCDANGQILIEGI